MQTSVRACISLQRTAVHLNPLWPGHRCLPDPSVRFVRCRFFCPVQRVERILKQANVQAGSDDYALGKLMICRVQTVAGKTQDNLANNPHAI